VPVCAIHPIHPTVRKGCSLLLLSRELIAPSRCPKPSARPPIFLCMHNNQRLQNEVREISIGGGAWPYRGGAMLNFALTEFYEVRLVSVLGG
jgi:hypothetical protein